MKITPELKKARKAVEKQTKAIAAVHEKLTGEKPVETDSPKFQKELDKVKDALDNLEEALEALEALLESGKTDESEED